MVPAAAASSRPCAATGPYVVLTAPHPAPANVDVAAVVERLREELAGRGVELCAGTPPAPAAQPLATVRLEAGQASAGAPAESVTLDIEVRDQVTAKRVGREIDLAGTPRDGRGVVVALAADELLRASWAELSLERAPKPRVALPKEVRAAIAPPPSPPPRASFGVRGVAEWWSGGLSLFGGDVDAAVRVSPRWSLHLDGGVRAAPDLTGADGTASTRALALRVGPVLALGDPSRPPFVGWGVAAAGYALEIDARATPPARADSKIAAALTFETGPSLRVPIADVGLSLALGASFAVAARGPAILDGASRVAALSGVAGMATVGIGTP